MNTKGSCAVAFIAGIAALVVSFRGGGTVQQPPSESDHVFTGTKQPLGVSDMSAIPFTGWGIFTLNLVTELARQQQKFEPLVLQDPHATVMDPMNDSPGGLSARFREIYKKQLADGTQAKYPVGPVPVPLVHGMANAFAENSVRWGTKNAAVCFLEQTEMEPEQVARAKKFDLVMTGSEWNTATLRDLGIAKVVTIRQGVDVELFKPGPGPTNLAGVDLSGRFVVFSVSCH
jgi:hypothetical protein